MDGNKSERREGNVEESLEQPDTNQQNVSSDQSLNQNVETDVSLGQQNLSAEEQQFIQQIVDFGYSFELARQAAVGTNFVSLNEAINWILDKAEAVSSNSSTSSADSSPLSMNRFKMVMVVNNELKMGVGKLAAQVAHAAVDLYHKMERSPPLLQSMGNWYFQGQPKVVLRGDNADHLVRLKELAEANNLPAVAIHDAGRTQIPAGSLTVISIFGPVEKVDAITGQLRLM